MGNAASAVAREEAKKPLDASDVTTLEQATEEIIRLRKELWNHTQSSSGSPFDFKSGLFDCVKSDPNNYTVKAEIPNARLVEMVMAPGAEDSAHDHPAHSMYLCTDVKLSVTPYNNEGSPAGEPEIVEAPAGAAPIFPAGPHQVKNIGDSEVKVIFIEPYPTQTPAPCVEDFVAPFECNEQYYTKLAEDDNWITGLMTMAPGQEDDLHNHRDHLIYVLEGDEVTIYPEGDKDQPQVVPIAPGAGLPAPVAAGAIFTRHIVKNSGSSTCKLLFFEKKE